MTPETEPDALKALDEYAPNPTIKAERIRAAILAERQRHAEEVAELRDALTREHAYHDETRDEAIPALSARVRELEEELVDAHDRRKTAERLYAERHNEAVSLRDQLDVARACVPKTCPITGREHFMDIKHPDLGWVPTYGGPYDSYTIPERDDDGRLSCHHCDHDRGSWAEGTEDIGLMVVDDEVHETAMAERDSLRDQLRRVEGERDISEFDVEAEGVTCELARELAPGQCIASPFDAWRALWESINGKRPGCAWEKNPWVWVVEFKRLEAT